MTIKAAAILCIIDCALCINISCSSDESLSDSALRPIEFKATGLTAIGNTRSTVEGNWTDATGSVGIMIDGEVRKYSVGSDGSLTSDTPFYWDDITESKTVTAWYPYTEGDTEQPSADDVVKEDQSEKADYLASDFLAVSSTLSYSENENELEFNHQVARITINVTDGFTNEKMDCEDITLIGGYTPYQSSTGVYDVLVSPMTIYSDMKVFTLRTSEGIFTYYAPTETEINFAANSHTTYNVTVTLDGLEVTSVSNETGWTEGDDVDVESIDLSKYGIDLSKYDGIVFLSNLTGTYTTENTNVLIIGDGNTYSCPIVVSESTSNVTLLNVKLSISDTNPISCNGDVTITLMGENVLEATNYSNYSAINIAENKTLTIDGTGSLTASSYFGAGIGGNRYSSSGNIVINGGTINATSDSSAGIGASQSFDNTISCGTITINGGTINATSYSGAGIGSGYGFFSIDRETNQKQGVPSSCGKITITGGTITAQSTANGAGIGSGFIYSQCDDIEITGGNITANGGSYGGAGIGSGFSNSSCGTITISGSNTVVTAKKTGNYSGGSDIGAGRNSSCGTVTISGGATVNDKTYE